MFSNSLNVLKNIGAAIKRKRFSMAVDLMRFRFLQRYGLVRNRLYYQSDRRLHGELRNDGFSKLECLDSKRFHDLKLYLKERVLAGDSFDQVFDQMKASRKIVQDYAVCSDVLSLCFSKNELSSITSLFEAGSKIKCNCNLRFSIGDSEASYSQHRDAAQEFHRDADHIAFVKAFCYLSDVSLDNGPHQYIRGSHRRFKFVVDRHNRVDEKKISRALGLAEVVSIEGLAGLRFVCNTLGYHRGAPIRVSDNSRIMLMFTFSNDNVFWGSEESVFI